MGQKVYVLDPFGSAKVPDRLRASFNPLTAIDLTSNRARAAISAVANGLVVVHDPSHMEWISGARSLLAGIIAYVLVDAPPEHHNFATVRQILMQPSGLPDGEDGQPQGLYADAQTMAQDTRMGGLIRSAGITLMTAIETEKGMEKDFLGLARRATEWLDDEAIAKCLDHSTFNLSELKTGDASVYLVLPADGDFLQTYGAFLRLFVKSALTAMGVSQDGKRCLFILDEFFSLGKLEEISDAAGRMPSYGVHLWPFLQDLGQAHQLYGESGTETFFGNSDAQIFFGNTDPKTLEYASKMIGNLRPEDMTEPRPVKEFIDPQLDVLNAWVAHKHSEDLLEYQHKMSAVGSPRIPPETFREMVAKPHGESLAKSMVVFARGGHRYHLRLQPYFEPLPPIVPSSDELYAIFKRHGITEKAQPVILESVEALRQKYPDSRGAAMSVAGLVDYFSESAKLTNSINDSSVVRWFEGTSSKEEFMEERAKYLAENADAPDRLRPTVKK